MLKRGLAFTALCIMLLGGLLPSSCADARHWSASLDRVIGDGAGGAITLYAVMKGANRRDFYVQRISPAGEKMWGANGTLVGTADKGSVAASNVRMVTDGSSGAIIVQTNSGYAVGKRTITLSRVDSSGKLVWQRDSAPVDRIVADGQGGAIAAWVAGTTISLNRFDSMGRPLWGESGTAIDRPSYGSNSLELADDGDGGAIIAWLETDPARARAGQPVTTEEVHAQRIDADGRMAWGNGGITLYVSPEDAAASWLRMARDEDGNAFLAWQQYATVTIESGSPQGLLFGVRLQKLDPAGAGMWEPNGVMLRPDESAGPGNAPPMAPEVLGDGAGGVIVTWQLIRPGEEGVYAQKVSADGSVLWQAGGVKTLSLPVGVANSVYTMSDGTGGVIVATNFYDLLPRQRGVRMLRLDAEGNTAWVIEPVNVSVDVTLGTFTAVSDGQGGVLLAWATRKTDMSDAEVSFVQRIDSNGELLWGHEGIRLSD